MSIDADYDEILSAVAHWPPQRRASLAHKLLGMSQPDHPTPLRPNFADALGMGRGQGPPPTPEQTRQWIREHWMEKYDR